MLCYDYGMKTSTTATATRDELYDELIAAHEALLDSYPRTDPQYRAKVRRLRAAEKALARIGVRSHSELYPEA